MARRARGITTSSRPKGGISARSATASSLAGQARLGSIDAFGDPEIRVPFFKRYFLGGATNLRGWGRYEVSPLSGDGAADRRRVVPEFLHRAARPVWRKLGAVIFLDGGNVWTNPWDFELNDLRYDVGPGSALPDADRSDPGGHRLPAESHSRAAGQRRAGSAALPLPLQHRTGVLTRSAADAESVRRRRQRGNRGRPQ